MKLFKIHKNLAEVLALKRNAKIHSNKMIYDTIYNLEEMMEQDIKDLQMYEDDWQFEN